MVEEELKYYEYLWTTEKQNWALLTDEESQREKDYVIYHIKTWRLLNIEDLELHRAIVERMTQAGVSQVTDEDIFGRK